MAKQAREIFELEDGQRTRAVIRVIGVGGGGCNTVNQMAQQGIEGVEFICANTDRDHLERSITPNQLQLGTEITRGLGAGSDPEVGRKAAEEDRERIREMIEGTDLLFITAGMGGGTGTGAAPVIAQISKELGILTVAVVTKPFVHENRKRMAVAQRGIDELRQYVDSLILIPNEKLGLVLGTKISVLNCFKAANDVLHNGVQGISDLITRPGLVNIDFADVRTALGNRGMSMMGIGHASGEDRAQKAVEMALSSPLLDDIELHGAQGLLVNITCDESLSMEEMSYINSRVNEIADEEVDTKCGVSVDPSLDGELRVTVVATGLMSAQEQVRQYPTSQNPNVTSFPNPRGQPTTGYAPQHGAQQRPQQPRATQPQVPQGGYSPQYGGGYEPQQQMPQRRVAAGGGSRFPFDIGDDVINIPAFLRNQAD